MDQDWQGGMSDIHSATQSQHGKPLVSKLGDKRPVDLCHDVVQIKNTLGWEPTVALKDGLLLMIDDFKERLKHERPVKALS